MAVILASGSPRRKELLEMLGIEDLKIIPAKGEESVAENLGPGELVMALAAQKGREVRELCTSEDVIISADTIVWHEDRVYGKPRSRENAIEMLRSLQGRAHQVYTGVCVIKGECEVLRYNMSEVYFRSMSEDEIEAYVDRRADGQGRRLRRTGQGRDFCRAHQRRLFQCYGSASVHPW